MKLKTTLLACVSMLLFTMATCTKKGDLGFHITDALNGTAVSGAYVGLANNMEDLANNHFITTGTSGADGMVIFSNIEKGEYAYTVRINDAQYTFNSAVAVDFNGRNRTISAPITP